MEIKAILRPGIARLWLMGAVCCSQQVWSEAIPEPSLVLYGQARDNTGGLDARLTSGELSWTWVPVGGGAPVVVATQLANVNDQFSFVLFIPCESEAAGRTVSSNTLKLALPSATYVRTNVTWNGQPLVFRNAGQGSFTLSATARGRVERVDLGLGQFPADSDGDGLPDWWEASYPLAGNPNEDSDGDGLTNLKEYIAGTDPQDADSSFEFVRVGEESPGTVLVEWSSVAGKRYAVLRSPTLSTNRLDYEAIQSSILSQGVTTSYRDTTAGRTHFYRVQVEE